MSGHRRKRGIDVDRTYPFLRDELLERVEQMKVRD